MQYSVVVPIYNEEKNIKPLIAEIEHVMSGLKKPWELICINDGSTDNSHKILKKLASKKKHLKIINFTKNFGQSSAFDAGFQHSKGEIVITIDGDGQNDPADIPKLINAITDCDLACGWRTDRKDPKTKTIISKMANAIRKRLCKDSMNDTNCSLKAYKKSSLKKIKMYNGMHRFLPALFKIEGMTVKAIPVNHRYRKNGKSKYNIFNRSINTITDMLVVMWMRKRHLSYKIKTSSTKREK